MTDNDDMQRAAYEHDQPPIISAELQPAVQSVMATLADLDSTHQIEVEKVESSGFDGVFKSRLIAKLDQLHRERRDPYAQELVRLQKCFRSLRSREPV